MTTASVLQHLKKHGQLLDSELAAAIKLPIEEIRLAIAELAERKEISQCRVTTFKNGKPIEGVQCRISGYAPPAAPGRKASK